ncbi:MAG: hypothetical protein AAB899_05130 [Patescibacteria group bacterium]
MKKRKQKKNIKLPLSSDEVAVLQAIADEGSEFLTPAGSEEEVKEWLNCGWKRIPCGKRSCPICGRIARDREKLEREGKDPDSLENSMEIVGANLAEALIMIRKDAEAMGIDIENLNEVKDVPEPERFPLAVAARKWHVDVIRYGEKEQKRGATWIMTEAAADLFWYAGTFDVKIYRQFCNRWHLDSGHTYGAFDYDYTGKVLKQVIGILNSAWTQVLDLAPSSNDLHRRFRALAKDIEPFLK